MINLVTILINMAFQGLHFEVRRTFLTTVLDKDRFLSEECKLDRKNFEFGLSLDKEVIAYEA